MKKNIAPKIENKEETDQLTSKQRILFILPQPFLATRGSSFRALATIRGICSLGYLVDVIAYPFGEDLTLPGVTYYRSWRIPGMRSIGIGPSLKKILCDVFLAVTVFKLMKKRRYALIHGVEEAGIIGGFFARRAGVPYVLDMHSWMSGQLADAGLVRYPWLLRCFTKIQDQCIQNAAAVITVGDILTKDVHLTAPQVPGFTLEDYPLKNQSTPQLGLYAEFQQSLNLANKKIILYTGNLEPYQGIDLLLQAFSILSKQVRRDDGNSPLILLIVGGEGKANGQLARYRELAHDLQIDDCVVFTGERPSSEMNTFVSLAEVLVSPRTLGENPPLKVYSYMAAEKIIVATRITSHTQVLNEESALLAEPTPVSLAEALFMAIDASETMKEKRRLCVAAALKLVETRFNEDVFNSRLAECYQTSLRQSYP